VHYNGVLVTMSPPEEQRVRGMDVDPDITTNTTELSRRARWQASARVARGGAEVPGVLVEAILSSACFRASPSGPQRSSSEKPTLSKGRSSRCRVVE
jgi:hypothetical protein